MLYQKQYSFMYFIVCFISFCVLSLSVHASKARLKDIADIQGVRGNDLVGYGLVVGLNGTGDSVANSPYTEEALQNMLERLGINVSEKVFA